jgi:hypothetical protein
LRNRTIFHPKPRLILTFYKRFHTAPFGPRGLELR